MCKGYAMANTTTENRIQFDTIELSRRNQLLEETLRKKEDLLQSLQGSEKRYRRLFQSAQDGILIIDADTGRVDDANPFLLDLVGSTYDRMYGKHLWELGVFQDIAESKEAFKTLQDNHYIRYDNLPLLTLDGRHIEVEFISNVFLVDGKKVIQCNIRDSTARKQSERTLAENETKMRSILDNIGIGVALISPGLVILEMNQRMRDWFPDIDIDRDPLCYEMFNDPPSQDIPTTFPVFQTLRDGKLHEITCQVMRAGGRRDYRIVSSPVCSASGEVTAVIEMIEDITERLSLESQFLQAQKLESIGRLAGGVAHDYNNMLGVILGYAGLAQAKLKASDPVYGYLQEILKAGSRSAEITRQLLGFASKQTITPKVIDLNDTVAKILKMLAPLIGEDIDFIWLPGENLHPVRMDPTQLDQIMANLCINARDAIAGVGTITVETAMVSYDKSYCENYKGFIPGDFVLLSVSDDGCGMEKEIQKNVFEPFFTTKEADLGTGLGLSTVYGIVKQNQGFINVYSEPANGTVFRVYLHGYTNEAPNESTSNPSRRFRKNRNTATAGHGETVLVVEDEAGVQKLMKRMLEDLGYIVLTAGSAKEALQLTEIHGHEIRLAITDVIMPEMNGRELADRLKARHPDLAILFMSGYTSEVISRLGIPDQEIHFIEKPFSVETLANKVHALLAQKQDTV
jgi:two-component system, cell cycle sensor histidine kinase and response regulator CckA